MVDTTAELIEGMRDMRVRNAILVTALIKLGGRLEMTHQDVYASAAHDIVSDDEDGKITLTLRAAPIRRLRGNSQAAT